MRFKVFVSLSLASLQSTLQLILEVIVGLLRVRQRLLSFLLLFDRSLLLLLERGNPGLQFVCLLIGFKLLTLPNTVHRRRHTVSKSIL